MEAMYIIGLVMLSHTALSAEHIQSASYFMKCAEKHALANQLAAYIQLQN